MSNDLSAPNLPLDAGLVEITNYPIVAGAFLIVLFGSNSQSAYESLKARFGKKAVVDFFPSFNTFFTYSFTKDPSDKIFDVGPVQKKPDPTDDLPGFIAALNAAGTSPSRDFSARQLLDQLVTEPIRLRGYAVLDRDYGPGSASSFEAIFGAIVVDALARGPGVR